MKVYLCSWPPSRNAPGDLGNISRAEAMKIFLAYTNGGPERSLRVYLGAGTPQGGRDRNATANTSPGQLGRVMADKVFLGAQTNPGASHQDSKAMAKVFLGDAQGRQGKDLKAMAPTTPGSTATDIARRPLRILLSYHYYQKEDIGKLLTDCFAGVPLEVFCDSGAFSAFTVGKKVVATEYIAWVKKWQRYFDVVAGPDVIGDPKATTRATEQMLADFPPFTPGVPPILPTFHVGEPWEFLEYWGTPDPTTGRPKVPYMAFGGMVPYTRQRPLLDAWITKCFTTLAKAGAPEDFKVHGFGLTTWSLLLKHPFFSVDSSSWTAGFRYAQLALFDETLGRFVQVAMNQPQELLRHQKLLARYGMRSSAADSRGYDRDVLCGVCVESWQRAEAYLEKRTKKGLRTYLVGGPGAGTPNHPKVMGPAVQKHRARKGAGK